MKCKIEKIKDPSEKKYIKEFINKFKIKKRTSKLMQENKKN